MELLHLQDAEENKRRLEKMQTQKTERFLERMTQEEDRILKAQRDKEHQASERKRLQEILDKEKLQILKDFEKQKKRLKEGQNLDKSQFGALLDLGSTQTQSRFQLPPITETYLEATADTAMNGHNTDRGGEGRQQTGQTLSSNRSLKTVKTKKESKAEKKQREKLDMYQSNKGSVTSRKKVDVTPYISTTPKGKKGNIQSSDYCTCISFC